MNVSNSPVSTPEEQGIAVNPTSHSETPDAEAVRATQRQRTSALLNADIQAAAWIHAADFQLISPLGGVFSKDQYLGAVAAGVIKYASMELDSPVDARVYGEVVLIRYRAQIEVDVQGQRYPRDAYWFTDAYEKREGRWQIVWSQGTGITN
jgi:hypothetical protein